MLTNEEKKEILDLLHQEVVPAIGCTEPMAVALCVAKAVEELRNELGKEPGFLPEKISLRLSANILKNAMGVGIPGTGGMIGLPIAIALGAVGGKSCLELEVLRDCTEKDLEVAKRYITEKHIEIKLEEDDPDKLYIHHDKWASPQVFVDIAASSEASLCDLLRRYSDRIINELYAAEYRRMAGVFYRDRNVDLMKRVEKKFGFTLNVPQEFTIAKDDDGFVWLMKRTKDFDLNVLVHVEPYRDEQQFSTVKILNRLDTTMRRNVPGPAEGSYMGTERRVDILTNVVDFEGAKYAVESRGQWRLFGDFMGGPFVNYTLLSPDGIQLVELTGFVYCPRFDKRDYLMQVDGICRSLKWPSVE